MAHAYMEECRINHRFVHVYTTNGFLMKGKIIDFDDESVTLLCGTEQHLVFKHAISTIAPAKTKNNA